MKIIGIWKRSADDSAFHESLREAIHTLHHRLMQAKLATPEIKKYLNGVSVIKNWRMLTRAGSANHTTQTIQLNAQLLARYRDELLETVVHEAAHLLAYKLYGERGHSRTWKQLMVALGFEPRRCHAMRASWLWKERREMNGTRRIHGYGFLRDDVVSWPGQEKKAGGKKKYGRSRA